MIDCFICSIHQLNSHILALSAHDLYPAFELFVQEAARQPVVISTCGKPLSLPVILVGFILVNPASPSVIYFQLPGCQAYVFNEKYIVFAVVIGRENVGNIPRTIGYLYPNGIGLHTGW